MIRSRFPWFLVPVALSLAACIVVVQSPPALTPALTISTITPPPTITPVVSPTAMGLETPPPLPTPLPSFTPFPAQAPGFTPAPLITTPIPISIKSFTISPNEIHPGDSVTVAWDVSAEQVTLYRLDALGRLDQFFNVPLAGAMVFTTTLTVRNHVDFMLFANSGGSSASASVSAKVLCPDAWFFLDPPGDCPGSPPNHTIMQAEHFERGFMLWTQWKDWIFIFYADSGSPRWEVKANAWFDGMPVNDPSLVPPAGLFQPIRGFGVAWRDEQVPAGNRVRDRLGWAIDQEFPVYNAAYQCDSAPKYNRCYITGPGNVVYVLLPERSGWFAWVGPTPAP